MKEILESINGQAEIKTEEEWENIYLELKEAGKKRNILIDDEEESELEEHMQERLREIFLEYKYTGFIYAIRKRIVFFFNPAAPYEKRIKFFMREIRKLSEGGYL